MIKFIKKKSFCRQNQILVIFFIILFVFPVPSNAYKNSAPTPTKCLPTSDINYSNCRFNQPNLGITDWKVTQCTWAKKSDKSLCAAFQTDAILFYNTLFPNQNRIRYLSLRSAVKDDEEKRELFLKRLFLYLVIAPLRFTSNEKLQDLKPWPYPLATALAHGGRLIIEVDDLSPQVSLYRKLLTGNWTQLPGGDIRRAAASHGMRIDKSGRVQEEKLGFAGSAKNLSIGLRGAHRGYNIAFGGLANEDNWGRIIGPQGSRYDRYGKLFTNIQHGHVYIQPARYGQKQVLLLGIEQSAPGKENAHGHSHSALSAFQDSSRIPGLTGDVKMVKLLPPSSGGPAPYGGMRVILTKAMVEEVEELLGKINKLPLVQQEKIFKVFLTSSASKSNALLKRLKERLP